MNISFYVLFQIFLCVFVVELAPLDGWNRLYFLFITTPEYLGSFATFIPNSGCWCEKDVNCNTATHPFYHQLFSLSTNWPFWLQLVVPEWTQTNIIMASVASSNTVQCWGNQQGWGFGLVLAEDGGCSPTAAADVVVDPGSFEAIVNYWPHQS